MAIVLDVKVGESISISGRAVVTVLEKSGQRSRLSIKAGDDVKVERVKPAVSHATGAEQAKAGIAIAA